MAESSDLMLQARDHLATPSHQRLASVVNQLFMRQESDEYQTARALYDFCVANFSNCLTLMLLKVYRCSSDEITRSRSMYLLSEILTYIRKHGVEVSLVALHVMKPLVLSETEIEILRRIVSFVLMSSNG
ncbi:unnamed protein product [Microthlaspi erraticum]|uniref:Clathrin/coatomer adaptor adaptin-like N-terminal domain-containing protein n=1 Tax=Microthlaspi erraticum TaxID=1685480 RepID=A0A6D2L481_9BRAS|nr:unnamed protein product [Microthlaspi erraticum]